MSANLQSPSIYGECIAAAHPNAVRVSLTDQAHQHIEEMIVMVVPVLGEIVSESLLSNLIGIGTSPIREALKRLAREYLVKIIPRSGVVVTNVNVCQQLDVLLDTRRVLDRLISPILQGAQRWLTTLQYGSLRVRLIKQSLTMT